MLFSMLLKIDSVRMRSDACTVPSADILLVIEYSHSRALDMG